MRWGDKQGGYGEHYWDLNHAGHAGNHGNNEDDDGSYKSDESSYDSPYRSDDSSPYRSDGSSPFQSDDSSPFRSDDNSYRVRDTDSDDTYDEPSEQSPKYTEYDSEKAQKLEEANRAKRAHPRLKAVSEHTEESPRKPQKFRIVTEATVAASNVNPVETTEEPFKKLAKLRQPVKEDYQESGQDDLKAKSTTQVHTQHPSVQPQNTQYSINVQEQSSQYRRPLDQTQYVPYESGAGVRQYQSPELSAAASVPRLFVEPGTGHVVDRATGQAYILQPVAINNNYN